MEELWDEIAEDFDSFRRESKYKKLSREQWFALDEQFKITPECRFDSNNYNFMPSGEHFRLAKLVRDLTGITPDSRHHAVQIAEDLLTMGYK